MTRWGRRVAFFGGITVVASGIAGWYLFRSDVRTADTMLMPATPTSSEMIAQRGQYAYQKKIILTQVAAYRKALEVSEGDNSAIRLKLAEAFRQLARAAHTAGAEFEAKAYFQELLAYAPTDAEALEFLKSE